MTTLLEARDALLKALAMELLELEHPLSPGHSAAIAYLAALEAPQEVPAPAPTVSEEAIEAALHGYGSLFRNGSFETNVRNALEAAAPILTRELAEENARLKRDCEVFITSNCAMTEELLTLRAELDRIKNPSYETVTAAAIAIQTKLSIGMSFAYDIARATHAALIAGAEDAKP